MAIRLPEPQQRAIVRLKTPDGIIHDIPATLDVQAGLPPFLPTLLFQLDVELQGVAITRGDAEVVFTDLIPGKFHGSAGVKEYHLTLKDDTPS